MKKLPAILLMLMICFSSVAQKNNPSGNNQEKNQNSQGNNDQSKDKDNKENGAGQPNKDQEKKDNQGNQTQDTKITPGASGVKRSIGYRFNSQVAEGDPGNGVFRFNSESAAKATYMIVDDLDVSGEDQSKWYSTWDDTTGATGRGQITLVESEGKGVVSYDVTGVFVDASGFWKIPVKHVSGAIPVNGATYYYVFERIDHKKEQAQNVSQPNQEVRDTNIVSQVVTPIEQSNPVEEVKPIEQPKPVEEVKPVEQPKPVEEIKPVEQPKPVEEVKPVEQPKPVEEVKPVEQPKPVEEVKPVEQPKPVEEVKPVEQPKPVEEVKPVEQPKPEPSISRTQREPTQRTQAIVSQTTKATEKPAPAQNTAATTTQAAQRSGTTWTTQVTHGAQPVQNEPVTNQYNQSSQTNPLPSYQYRYSTNKRGRGKWYAGIIEAGYGLGVGEYGIDNFRLNFINGFHLGQTFSAGLGIGVRRYFVERETFTDYSLVSGKVQIPVFLDLRKTFSTNTVTPYLALGIGNSTRFSAGDTTTVKEGLLFNPSGGIWFNLSSRFAIFCGVAYEMQKMEYLLLADDSRYKKNTSSISLNIGIAF